MSNSSGGEPSLVFLHYTRAVSMNRWNWRWCYLSSCSFWTSVLHQNTIRKAMHHARRLPTNWPHGACAREHRHPQPTVFVGSSTRQSLQAGGTSVDVSRAIYNHCIVQHACKQVVSGVNMSWSQQLLLHAAWRPCLMVNGFESILQFTGLQMLHYIIAGQGWMTSKFAGISDIASSTINQVTWEWYVWRI